MSNFEHPICRSFRQSVVFTFNHPDASKSSTRSDYSVLPVFSMRIFRASTKIDCAITIGCIARSRTKIVWVRKGESIGRHPSRNVSRPKTVFSTILKNVSNVFFFFNVFQPPTNAHLPWRYNEHTGEVFFVLSSLLYNVVHVYDFSRWIFCLRADKRLKENTKLFKFSNNYRPWQHKRACTVCTGCRYIRPREKLDGKMLGSRVNIYGGRYYLNRGFTGIFFI